MTAFFHKLSRFPLSLVQSVDGKHQKNSKCGQEHIIEISTQYPQTNHAQSDNQHRGKAADYGYAAPHAPTFKHLFAFAELPLIMSLCLVRYGNC